MKRYVFDVGMHEDYGTLGFKPRWYQGGDPLTGMAIPHDILEHFPHDNGQAEGEYLALGACLWIRGEGGYQQNGSPEENIAPDLSTVWGVHTYQHRRTSVRPCGLIRNDAVMDQAREAVRIWLRDWNDQEETVSAEDQERIARWIGKGYMRAQRQYRNHSAHAVCALFQEIEQGATKALNHADEGMQLTVLVDYTNLKCRMDCDYPYDQPY